MLRLWCKLRGSSSSSSSCSCCGCPATARLSLLMYSKRAPPSACRSRTWRRCARTWCAAPRRSSSRWGQHTLTAAAAAAAAAVSSRWQRWPACCTAAPRFAACVLSFAWLHWLAAAAVLLLQCCAAAAAPGTLAVLALRCGAAMHGSPTCPHTPPMPPPAGQGPRAHAHPRAEDHHPQVPLR